MSLQDKLFFILIGSYSLIILLLDYIAPLGLAVGTLYIIVILATSFLLESKKNLYLITFCCCFFIVLGYFISPSTTGLLEAVINRGISLFIVLIGCLMGALFITNRLKENTRNEQFQQAIEAAPNAMVMTSISGEIVFANHEMLSLFGYKKEELLHTNIDQLVPSASRAKHSQYRKHFLQYPKPRAMGKGGDLYGLRKDGSQFPVEIGLNPIQMQAEMMVISSILNISERKESENKINRYTNELERTSIFLKGLLENAVDGIISIDKTGNILTVNPAAEELFGYAVEEMIGQNVKMLMPTPYHEEHDGYLSNYHKTGDKKIIGIGREVVGQRKNGSTFPMELSVSENRAGSSHSFTGIVRDISERVSKQKEIEDQKFYYENLFQNLNVPAFIIDPDHKVILWNRAAEILTGVEASEILGTTNHQKVIYNEERPVFADLVLEGAFDNPESFPADLEYPVDIEQSLMPGGKRVQNWVEFPRSGKTSVYLTIDAGPIYDSEGKKIAVIQVMQDITSMKKLEDTIQDSNDQLKHFNENLAKAKQITTIQKEYYESLISDLGAPVFVIDKDHKVTTWNKACEELTGLAASKVLGTDQHWKGFYREKRRMFADIIIDNDYSDKEKLFTETSFEDEWSNESDYIETWNEMENGTYRYVRAFCNPLVDHDNNIIAVAEVFFDLTQLKESHFSLEARQEELQRSNEELEQFAYVASHDLQEPLRMIASYTNLLSVRYKDKLDTDANDFINYAVDGAKRMQTLINDLLSISQLDTKGNEFSIIDTDKLCQDVLNDLSISIKEENAVVSKDELPKIKGDELQIRQLFQNLISNAIKYSDPERKNNVHISSTIEHGQCKFIISDSGIGIAPQYFEKIFIIFKRLHSKDAYSGTGIGLSICKKIVAIHGGVIGLESKPGQGSSFYFTVSLSL